MAVLRCPVCGGELDVNADLTVGVCKYCDSVITIPKELDRKGNLYNRAVFLRQNKEFDKALEAYEDILKEDNADAEAHWGLVLSKFGIEYVSDPKTKQWIPTCHRTQRQSILSDPDYLEAVACSPQEAQAVIENEGKRIHEIQAKILEFSQKEQPYDIFICYKESDESGNRTEDSTIAQDLYYELEKKGYRTFFARKTLESKLGAEYEPLIFSALNSAKVMIVLGTKADYFTSPWVKNEWSRYLSMSEDSKKIIIPTYRNISPYELPAELSLFQSLDMSKIGFMQDLVDGIERCVRSDIKKSTQAVPDTPNPAVAPPADPTAAQVERLLQNSETYLKLGNYELAEEVFQTLTREYPENYRGWWGLIVCKTKNFSHVLSDRKTVNTWLQYTRKLASPEEYAELESQYVAYSKRVAQAMVVQDIEKARDVISRYTERKKVHEQRLEALTNKIKVRTRALKEENKTVDRSIGAQKSRVRSAKKNVSGTRRERIFGLLLAAGGVALAVWSPKGITYVACGLCLIIGGALFFGSFSKMREEKSALEEEKREWTKLLNEKKASRTYFNQEIEQIKKEMIDTKVKMDALDERISCCQSYLNFGKDQIVELLFAKECAKFGVAKPTNQVLQELRARAIEADPDT